MKLAFVGCGAITEQYYAPAVQALKHLEVVGLLDPSPARLDVIKKPFPNAKSLRTLDELAEVGAQIAIIASPSAHHARQAIQAMELGMNVLCEKPMASTVAEAEMMIETADKTKHILAIGLFRRFFPSTHLVTDLIRNQNLGLPIRYEIAEGGLFDWPAASPTFFQKENSHGGVLHDLGVHVLDLVLHWFEEPYHIQYEDDTTGGLETNCLVKLVHLGGIEGEIRLSREWKTANRYFIAFERGWVGWSVGGANRLQMGFSQSASAVELEIRELAQHWGLPAPGCESLTYAQSFTAQLDNFTRAVKGDAQVQVTGQEGIRSLRLVEQCYASRQRQVTQ